MDEKLLQLIQETYTRINDQFVKHLWTTSVNGKAVQNTLSMEESNLMDAILDLEFYLANREMK